MTDLVVVGAGPAGLTAAWRAARAGLSVRVVERQDHVGGLTASETVAGQRVDAGSHRLHPAMAPELLDALRTLLGDDLQRRARHGRLRLIDTWIAFPLRAGDLARRLPPRFVASLALGGVVSRAGGTSSGTYEQAVRRRFGTPLLEALYGPYAGKLWGVEADALTGEVARHRISAAGPLDLVRRALAPPSAPRRSFLYPRRGFGQIGEALAEAASAAGATIELDRRVETVRPTGSGAEITVDGRAELAGRILWTAPPGALAAAVHGTPTPVRDDVARLRTRAMVLVYLVVDAPRYTEFDAHYLPDPAIAVSRVSEPKNYRDGPDPASHTVLCAEIPCWRDDPVWTDAERLGPELTLDGFDRAGMAPPALLETRVRRLPAVYPVLELATAAARSRVDDWAGSVPNVTVLGRQGLGVADNLHHVMAMGWDAGELAGRGWDDGRWAAARARYRTHVVED